MCTRPWGPGRGKLLLFHRRTELIKIFSSSFCSGFIVNIRILLSVGRQHRCSSWQKFSKLPPSPASTFDGQHVLWPEVHADVHACPLFHSVSVLQLLFWSEQSSVRISKASPHTFRKPLDPQFDRKVPSATLRKHCFTSPECLWTKAVFHRPALLPLIDEIHLRSFSKSLKGHTPDCLQGRCRGATSGFNCDSVCPVKIPWKHSYLFVLADTELKCPNRFKPPG